MRAAWEKGIRVHHVPGEERKADGLADLDQKNRWLSSISGSD